MGIHLGTVAIEFEITLTDLCKIYFVTGTTLGKAMDTDSRHNHEAIQVDASVPIDQNKD